MGAFNGTGTFVRSYSWVSDATNGINITASRCDTEDDGFAAGLSNCMTRDGQAPPTANIAWGNYNLTGVGVFSGASGGVTGTWTCGNASTVQDSAGTPRPIGYRGIPIVTKSSAYQIALSDAGQCIAISIGGITIPTNATTAFGIGDTVAIYNASSASQNITPAGGVTLRLGGGSTTGTRALAGYGFTLLLKVGTDEWVALNGGLS